MVEEVPPACPESHPPDPGPGTVSLAWASALDPGTPQMRSSSRPKPAMNARSTASLLGTDDGAVLTEATRCHRDSAGGENHGGCPRVGRGLWSPKEEH